MPDARTTISLKSYRNWELQGHSWRCIDFKNVDFAYADLSGCEFADCTFDGCLFWHSSLSTTKFSDTRFEDCDLSSATADGTKFSVCTFHMCCSDGLGLSGAELNNVLVAECAMRMRGLRLVMNKCQFQACDMSESEFVDTTLTDCTFENCGGSRFSLRVSLLNRVSFDGCVLPEADFSGLSMKASVARGSTFDRINTAGMKKTRCVFNFTIPTKKCAACGSKMPATNFSGTLPICMSCKETKGYSEGNSYFSGRATNLPTFSFEFEMTFGHSICDEESNQPHYDPHHIDPDTLLLHRFIKCSDGSVDVEYKSPIYLNTSAFHRAAVVMDNLAEHGCVGPHAGTHVHVGMTFAAKDRLRQHYDRVLMPMSNYMQAHRDDTVRFWGRNFTSYAGASRQSRYSWLNVNTNDKPTVEFRLSKYVNYTQFSTLVAFERKMVKYLERELSYARTLDGYRRIGEHVLAMYRLAVESSQIGDLVHV